MKIINLIGALGIIASATSGVNAIEKNRRNINRRESVKFNSDELDLRFRLADYRVESLEEDFFVVDLENGSTFQTSNYLITDYRYGFGNSFCGLYFNDFFNSFLKSKDITEINYVELGFYCYYYGQSYDFDTTLRLVYSTTDFYSILGTFNINNLYGGAPSSVSNYCSFILDTNALENTGYNSFEELFGSNNLYLYFETTAVEGNYAIYFDSSYFWLETESYASFSYNYYIDYMFSNNNITNRLETENKNLKSENEVLETENENLKSENENLDNRLVEWENAYNEMKSDRDYYKWQFESYYNLYNNKVSDYENLQNDYEDLEILANRYKTASEEKDKLLGTLPQENEDLKTQVQNLENQVSSLENQLASTKVMESTFDLLGNSFKPIISFLTTNITPNITIGSILLIPVSVAIILFILKGLLL